VRAYLLSLEAGANGGTLNLMLQSDMGQISNVLKLAGGFALGLRFGAVTHVTVQETDPDAFVAQLVDFCDKHLGVCSPPEI